MFGTMSCGKVSVPDTNITTLQHYNNVMVLTTNKYSTLYSTVPTNTGVLTISTVLHYTLAVLPVVLPTYQPCSLSICIAGSILSIQTNIPN
jgi:hypothetical protein